MARGRGGGGGNGGGGRGPPGGGYDGGGGGRGGGFGGGGGGRGRGRIPAGMRPVTEEQRIDIAVQLRDFQARACHANRGVALRSRVCSACCLRRRAPTRASPFRRACRTTTAPWCTPSAARRALLQRTPGRASRSRAYPAAWRLQLGFTSKSHGKGPTRAVTVSKARLGLAHRRNAASVA